MNKSLNIGFAGIGIMGGSMAGHILKAGYTLYIYNRTKAKPIYQQLLKDGAKDAENFGDLAKMCDVIFLCLDDDASVLNAIKKMQPHLKAGTTVVDMTTAGKQAAIEANNLLKHLKVHFMDAPVTGGDKGAKDATLTIMVGGEKALFDELLPLFQCMGKQVYLCGEVGAGQAVKSINQMLAATHLAAVCEAFSAAKASDIDPQLVVDICGSGMAGSKQLTALGQAILDGNFAPGFKAKHMQKDLKLLFENNPNLPAPLTKQVLEQFNQLTENEDFAEAGTQSLWKLY